MIVAELAARLGLIPDKGEWDKGHELIEGLHRAMEIYLGVQGLKKVKDMVEGTVEAAVSAKHLSEQLGVSTDAVQELGYAADVTGASAESMQLAMRRLALGMEHARKTGSGPLVDALGQLHVSFAEIRGKSPDQVLDVLANAFQKAGPRVNKTALAMELFGRQGAQLLPLLNRGAAGVEGLRHEAQQLGVVMDKEAIEKSEEFEIAQKRLGATLTGLRNTAVMALLPTLQEMVEGLMDWVRANREAIASTLQAVMEGIAEAFKLVGEAIAAATEFYQEHQEVATAVLVALGVVLTAFAVKSAIAWALAFLPVTLAIAAIALLVLGIKKLAEKIAGHAISWKQMWNAVLDGGRAVINWFEELPGRVAGWVEDVADKIKTAFKEAWAFVVMISQTAWEKVKDIGTGLKEGFLGAIGLHSGTTVANNLLERAQASGEAGRRIRSEYLASIAEAEGRPAPSAGDVNININASGMDADQVRDLARREAAEHLQDQVRQAYSAVGGAPQNMR